MYDFIISMYVFTDFLRSLNTSVVIVALVARSRQLSTENETLYKTLFHIVPLKEASQSTVQSNILYNKN